VEIEKSRIQEIARLHAEIVGHLRMSLDKAIRIGQLLTEQKKSLKHGEFTPWLKANIPFTDRTARNYMRLHQERDRIKTETVSDLAGAYHLLTEPKPLAGVEKIMHCYADAVNQAREDLGSWEKAFKAVSEESTIPMKHLVHWHRNFFGDVADVSVGPLQPSDFEKLASAFERIYKKAKQEMEHEKNLDIFVAMNTIDTNNTEGS